MCIGFRVLMGLGFRALGSLWGILQGLHEDTLKFPTLLKPMKYLDAAYYQEQHSRSCTGGRQQEGPNRSQTGAVKNRLQNSPWYY